MKIIMLISAALLNAQPCAAQDTAPPISFFNTTAPTTHFNIQGCELARISENMQDVSINWRCADDYAAGKYSSGQMVLYLAIILRAVHNGTYRDITPKDDK